MIGTVPTHRQAALAFAPETLSLHPELPSGTALAEADELMRPLRNTDRGGSHAQD